MLSSEHGEDNHLFGSGLLLEDPGAFVCGGASGKDVIDEENGLSTEQMPTLFTAAELEGSLEILEALAAGEEGLLGGEAGAAEGSMEGEVAGL